MTHRMAFFQHIARILEERGHTDALRIWTEEFDDLDRAQWVRAALGMAWEPVPLTMAAWEEERLDRIAQQLHNWTGWKSL